jgi:hypothetical protein
MGDLRHGGCGSPDTLQAGAGVRRLCQIRRQEDRRRRGPAHSERQRRGARRGVAPGGARAGAGRPTSYGCASARVERGTHAKCGRVAPRERPADGGPGAALGADARRPRGCARPSAPPRAWPMPGPRRGLRQLPASRGPGARSRRRPTRARPRTAAGQLTTGSARTGRSGEDREARSRGDRQTRSPAPGRRPQHRGGGDVRTPS